MVGRPGFNPHPEERMKRFRDIPGIIPRVPAHPKKRTI
jgi:hypothetical protein